jgi:hypothetical protein
MAEPKEHSVTVSIVSTSGGLINQEILLTEYASTPQELVTKHMTTSLFVVEACVKAMTELAEGQGLNPTGESNGKNRRN